MDGPIRQRLGNPIGMMADDNVDFADAALAELVDDVSDDRRRPERQKRLLHAHSARLPGCGNHGSDHWRAFRRTAMSWAAMLTAISGTVTAPMLTPIGAKTRLNSSSVANPPSRKLRRIRATLRRLPIMPI